MERDKTIITGVNGFVGHHLAKEMHDNNFDVIGIGLDPEPSSVNQAQVYSYIEADLSGQWPETNTVSNIIHLAGLAAVGPSFENPQKYIEINSSMVTNMCEYFLKQPVRPRIILVSSGSVYDSNQDMPLTEQSKISFNSPYAISKILNENQAAYYRNRGLDIVVARPFNHIGPGQEAGFLLPDLANGIDNALQTDSILQVGNLETKRDYTDVRDVVRAYRLLAITKKLGAATYNICSGKSIFGREILSQLHAEMNAPEINVVVDQSRIRPSDPIDIYGSYSQLNNDTGWIPQYDLQQTRADFVNNRDKPASN